MPLGDSENIKLHKNNWKSLKGYLKVKGSLTDLFYLSNQFFIQNYSLLRGSRQLEIIHIHYFLATHVFSAIKTSVSDTWNFQSCAP